MPWSALLLIAASQSVAVTSPEHAGHRKVLESAISQVKSMAVQSNKIDWPALEMKVRKAAEASKDELDLLRAYHVLVSGLGDGHSFVNVSAEDRAAFKARHGFEFDEGRINKAVRSGFTDRRAPEVRTLVSGARRIGLAVVPGLAGGDGASQSFAQQLADGLSKVPSSTCGYIVDLRGNLGGNIWPMFAGLSPLLGQSWRSYEQDRTGKISSFVELKRGSAVVASGEHKGATLASVQGWQSRPSQTRAPVAVLIDDGVASSGEGIAVAFKGRPRTRFFGQRTYGAASSNEGFVVHDRFNIVVTSALMADRLGRTYPAGVEPDEKVATNHKQADRDAVILAAMRWVLRQPSCDRTHPPASKSSR